MREQGKDDQRLIDMRCCGSLWKQSSQAVTVLVLASE